MWCWAHLLHLNFKRRRSNFLSQRAKAIIRGIQLKLEISPSFSSLPVDVYWNSALVLCIPIPIRPILIPHRRDFRYDCDSIWLYWVKMTIQMLVICNRSTKKEDWMFITTFHGCSICFDKSTFIYRVKIPWE